MTTLEDRDQAQEQADRPFGQPPALNLTDAAQTCGVSRSTIRRRREEGAFPGAYRDAAGGWLIPLPDLLSAGLVPAVTPPTGQPEQAQEHPDPTPVADPLMAQLTELRTALAVSEAKREASERLATERLERLEDMRRYLRVLEPITQPAITAGSAPERRRWLSRRS